jgi:serine/threonine protein kinase/Tol biopolymer transport system component
MGEVYLAEDTRLGRKVALKLLPAEFTSDAERVRRFEQEARAASALNHPNILTIFEIGEANGERFIATEFIDGQTLRERLDDDRLSPAAGLDIAAQIAAALAAAHEAGIIHRDIKPENVMLRRDGIVKVLDFGLAKLTERRPDAIDREAPTMAKVNTDPGMVMGTANYMSPEQARGQEVDARSDIFSLGVVLYEMIAGRAPFDGVNALDMIGAILNREPAPLSSHMPESTEATPAELQRIVTKALRKDRDERYQVVKEMLLDLKNLKQELEFEAKLKGVQAFVAPHSTGGVQTLEIPPEGGTTKAQKAQAATNEVAARTTSSAEYIVNQIRQHRTGALVILCVALAVIAGAGYGLYKITGMKPPAARFEKLKFTRLTTTGKVRGPVISPDGKYVAYINLEGGKPSLWLRQVASSQNAQIVPPSDEIIRDLAFSADSNFVYYRGYELNSDSTLYRVSVLGGARRKLSLGDVSSPVSFSPDGNRMVFARAGSDRSEMELVVANADGANEQRLVLRQAHETLLERPVWAPDGKVIACIARRERETFLVTIAADNGKEMALNQQPWESINILGWLPDGSSLVVTAAEKNGVSQVWTIAYPTGETRQVTNDLNGFEAGSLTVDGRALIALRSDFQSHIWLAPGGKADEARQITSGTSKKDGNMGLAWAPDGRLIYTSGDGVGLWTMDASGGNQKELTSSGTHPTAAADGRYVVFRSLQPTAGLWRIDADGGNLRQLTTGSRDSSPSCSPDGKWIVYESVIEGQGSRLWKIGIDGGSPTRLTDFRSTRPSVSPDGKQIACIYSYEGTEKPIANFGVIPFDGGPATKIAERPPSAHLSGQPIRWTPDGRSIAYLDLREGVTNIWSLPVGGGQPRQLTRFTTDRIYAFAWSPDGKWLAMSRGATTADAVLISEVNK